MAITKVTGHVIDPITNITSHNINSSGIITATRFDGPIGAGLTDGNFSGIITSTQLNVTGVGTFNGIQVTSLNVSGVSTIRDLNIDDGAADSAAGPELKLNRGSASPANADYLGQIKFAGRSSTGAERNYAKITGKILDVTNGSEDGILEFAHIKAGSQTITGRWRSDSLQLLNGTSLTVAGTADVTGNMTVGGNLNVSGVLTYEDVTNIDSLGIVTARTGIKVLAGGINAVGVVTATSFVGDGSALTGIAGTAHVRTASLTVSGVSTFSELVKFDANIGTTPSASGNVHIYRHDNKLKVCGGSGIQFEEGGFTRWHITNGALHPHGTTYNNLGNTSNLVGHVYLADSKKIHLGNDQDFTIQHDGSNAYVDTGTGLFYSDATIHILRNKAGNQDVAKFAEGASGCMLYCSNGVKLTTTTTGITVGGEVAASQDYPDFRPTLDLNFAAQKKLDPRIIYTRTGPASYINEFGKVVLVGDNVPRFDHDPTTRESKGLLVEESKTNLIPNSFDKGTWSAGSNGTLTRNAGIAPDGTNTATKASTTSNDIDTSPQLGNASAGATGQIAISGSTTYTLSIWAKASTIAQVGNNFKVRWKRVTGDSVSAETTFALTADWKRYSATNTTQANNTTMACYIGGVANSEALVWGAQLEVSSFATSLIPTYGSSATRGADAAFMDAIGDSFYNQNEGTSIVEYNYTEDTDGAHTLFSFTGTESDPDASNPRQWLRINKTAGTPRTIRYSLTTDAGSSSDDTSSAVATPGQWDKFAFAYTAGDQDLYLNGSSVNDLSRTPPINCYRLAFGTAGWALTTETIMLEGHIRRFMYYPKKLSNSQLGTLTS